jgi:hypothetical protein
VQSISVERTAVFELPLLIGDTARYAQLGVSPDALADEIREAKAEASVALDAGRAALDRELKQLEAAAPAAPAPAAADADPRCHDLRRRLEDVERRKIRLNQITIDNPEARQQHDREHPPLGLLKIEDAARDAFVENRTAITLLRRELSRFLAARGEEVFHPSDLHRDNFTADMTPNPLLDDAHD